MKQREWQKLRDLRLRFLSASGGQPDYWESDVLLELYDRFFAERIGWKWDAVLRNLQSLSWQPADQPLIDWGCGTGIAARSFLTFFKEAQKVEIWDRSGRARDFARQKLRLSQPQVDVRLLDVSRPAKGIYLLSHVLNELTASELDGLIATLLSRATAVLWIEPGTHPISRALGWVRERLRSAFTLLAPCPHQQLCGMLIPENERHWCHFFATPPAHVHQDAEWSAFARELEIDVRSIPYSYLVLARQPDFLPCGERLLGRPRFYKGHAKYLSCKPEQVAEKTLPQRENPALFKQLRKGICD